MATIIKLYREGNTVIQESISDGRVALYGHDEIEIEIIGAISVWLYKRGIKQYYSISEIADAAGTPYATPADLLEEIKNAKLASVGGGGGTIGGATEVKQDDIITSLGTLSTQSTSADILTALGKLISNPSTESKQDSIISEIQSILAIVGDISSGANNATSSAGTGSIEREADTSNLEQAILAFRMETASSKKLKLLSVTAGTNDNESIIKIRMSTGAVPAGFSSFSNIDGTEVEKAVADNLAFSSGRVLGTYSLQKKSVINLEIFNNEEFSAGQVLYVTTTPKSGGIELSAAVNFEQI